MLILERGKVDIPMKVDTNNTKRECSYRIPLRGFGSTRIAGSVEIDAESTKLAAL